MFGGFVRRGDFSARRTGKNQLAGTRRLNDRAFVDAYFARQWRTFSNRELI
jgi:hypothetical protein